MSKYFLRSASVMLLICTIIYAAVDAAAQVKKFRKVDAKGEANIIFSSQQIKLNQESSVKLKTDFIYGEPVYSRVYFPRPVGKLVKGERVLADMWIDGKFAGRVSYSEMDPSWDTMQLLISNTGSDDFNSSYLSGLSSGSHKIDIYVSREVYMKDKNVAKLVNENIEVNREKVYTLKYLSKGSFTLKVN